MTKAQVKLIHEMDKALDALNGAIESAQNLGDTRLEEWLFSLYSKLAKKQEVKWSQWA